MNHIRYQKLLRMGKRGMDITQAPNLHPAIELAAPMVSAAFLDFGRSLEELRLASDDVRAFSQESFEKLGCLRHDYDAARSAVFSLGITESLGQASRVYPVPEELLQVCQTLVSVLGKHGQSDAAQKVLASLTQALQQAQESWDRTLAARSNLQKLQTANRDNADKLEHAMVHLRQTVRSVYGRSSREYQLIRVSKVVQEEDASQSTPDTVQANTLTQVPNKSAA